MTSTAKLALAALLLAAAVALLRGAPPVTPVPALTPAQMAELAPDPTTADAELDAAPPDPDGS